MDMQQVDLGFTKFEATRQAILAFVFGFAFFLLSSVVALIPLYNAGIISGGFILALCILFAAIAILYGILVGYSINCMVVGKCIKLSWIISAFYIVLAVLYFLLLILSIASGSNNMPQTPISKAVGKTVKSLSAK
jgi:hypothetical protein